MKTIVTSRAMASFCAIFGAVGPHSLFADTAQPEPQNLMIVLDSSGSMWGQIDGKSKRDIAQDTLATILPRITAQGATGLIAYGHRTEGDCNDIEVLVAPAKGAEADIKTQVSGLIPLGKTPLSAAVEQAADLMSYADTKATVILVTDGLETCGANPCELGASLARNGTDFKAHVIGFGLSAAQGQQVACLAEETGGRYLPAANAEELQEAFEQIADKVEEPPVANVPPPEATITVSPTVEIGGRFAVRWTGPLANDDYIDLVKRGHAPTSNGSLVRMRVDGSSNGEMQTAKDIGDYDLRYVWVSDQGRTVLARAPISITEATIAIISPAAVGMGEQFTLTWRGPGADRDVIDIVARGNRITSKNLASAGTRQGDELSIQAPADPGEYDLRYVHRAANGKSILHVVPLEVLPVQIELAFAPTVRVGDTLRVDWKGPGANRDYIDIVPRGETRTSRRSIRQNVAAGNPVELRTPTEAGDYDLRYILRTKRSHVIAVQPLVVKE